jgi:hypothetical protein
VKDIAVAYEHSGYEPDEITQLYPDLTLADVHRALAYYYDHIDDFRSSSSEPASARRGRSTATRVSGFQSRMDYVVAGGRFTRPEWRERSATPTGIN